MVTTAKQYANRFHNYLSSVKVQIEVFDINRCDERTLYIPISLQKNNDKVKCDLIFLVDKKNIYGAISLNEHYDSARDFFIRHFNYELLYIDEQYIAKIVSSSPQFTHCMSQFAAMYPKYIQSYTIPFPI